MIHKVIMPALGMTMEQGTIVRWLKREGERVEAGEPLLEVMTDKLTMEVESPASGVVRGILAAEGQVVPVTHVIALVGPEDEDLAPLLGAGEGARETSAGPSASEREGRPPAERQAPRGAEPPAGLRASPAARRLAREMGIDLRKVAGTGPSGRIRASDVASAGSPADAGAARTEPIAGPPEPGGGMRAIIAKRMVESVRTTAPFTVTTEVDASGMVRLRDETRGRMGIPGGSLNYTAVIVKACAAALKEFPSLNASYSEDGVVAHPAINIGVAVALPEGLVVPVVRNADRKALIDIAVEIEALAKDAREHRLRPEQTDGGTFTVSNLGMTGVTSFAPIIRLPECCILGVGAIITRPAVTPAGALEARPIMNLALTADHRVTDGVPAARFLMRVKELLEAPAGLLL
ncbi:MAG: 2-oxo acid dehydrogenase subunit E2 [Firmicutes bacterium]|nr:2-oxo acid dehydrogenase subunit E2 [Bacillota bacterium]